MNHKMKTVAFPLGQTVITRGALAELDPDGVKDAIRRHATGDWGDCCQDDRLANEEALKSDARLFSVYSDRHGTKFWVITEADRSATTVLLPSEY